MIKIGDIKLLNKQDVFFYLAANHKIAEDFKDFRILENFFNDDEFSKTDSELKVGSLKNIFFKFLPTYISEISIRAAIFDKTKTHCGYYYIRGYDYTYCVQHTVNKNCPIFKEYWTNLGFLDHAAEEYSLDAFYNFNVKKQITSGFDYKKWMDKGYSEKEAKDIVREIQTKNADKYTKLRKDDPEKYKESSFLAVEYWLKKTNGDLIEAKKLQLENKPKFSLESCKLKYGEEEGYDIWKKRQDTWQLTLQSKPKEELDSINKRKDSSSMKWALKKCNGELNLAIDLYKTRAAKKDSASFNWALKKCEGDYNKAKSLYLESNHLRAQGSFNKTGRLYSSESITWFDFIYQYLLDKGVDDTDILWKDKELPLLNETTKRMYLYDFTIIPLKMIIEYHGIAFHPKSPTQDWIHPFRKSSALECYTKDQNKKTTAEKSGYTLIEVFSDEKIDMLPLVLELIDKKLDNRNRKCEK